MTVMRNNARKRRRQANRVFGYLSIAKVDVLMVIRVSLNERPLDILELKRL